MDDSPPPPYENATATKVMYDSKSSSSSASDNPRPSSPPPVYRSELPKYDEAVAEMEEVGGKLDADVSTSPHETILASDMYLLFRHEKDDSFAKDRVEDVNTRDVVFGSLASLEPLLPAADSRDSKTERQDSSDRLANDVKYRTKTKRRETRLKPSKTFRRFIDITVHSMGGQQMTSKFRYDCTVRDLKIAIGTSLRDMPIARQRLYFKGKCLNEPEGTLRGNGVVGESATLHVCKRLLTERAELLELPAHMKVNREVNESSESFRCQRCAGRLKSRALLDHTCDDCGRTGTCYRCPSATCDYDICRECWCWAASIFARQRSNIRAIWVFNDNGTSRPFYAEDSRYIEFCFFRHTYGRGRLQTIHPPSSVKIRVGALNQTYQIDFLSMTQTNLSSGAKKGIARFELDHAKIPDDPEQRLAIQAHVASLKALFPNRTEDEIKLVLFACRGSFDEATVFMAS